MLSALNMEANSPGFNQTSRRLRVRILILLPLLNAKNESFVSRDQWRSRPMDRFIDR